MTKERKRTAFGTARAVLRTLSAIVRGIARTTFAWNSSSPLRSAVRVVLIADGIALLAIGVAATCFSSVPHGSIGVKQVDFGERGIVERDYGPGLAFRLPVLQSWHLVDGRTQGLSFAWESEGGVAPPLEVRTRDGNVVKVGASVVYRVRRGEAWRLVADGLKNAWRERVRASAETVIAQELGGLSTSEIAATDSRLACAEKIRAELARLLAREHVEVEEVLVTQVWFGPGYEKKLQAKQLAVQQERLRDAAAEVDVRRGGIESTEQEIENASRAIAASWDLRIAERAARGKSEIATIRADTKFYSDTRRAEGKAEKDRLGMEGERILAGAEALKESLMRKALAGSGGRYWLARRAAENLNIRQVTLDSSDPRVPSVLDLDGMVRLLVGVPIAKSR